MLLVPVLAPPSPLSLFLKPFAPVRGRQDAIVTSSHMDRSM